MQPYLSDRAVVATKLKVARTAANAITTLWTYTPENMDSLADRAATYLSGDFAAQYRKFVDAIVAPNKQAKITNSTEVTGAAVESLEGSERRRHRLHQHYVHQPADQERPVAEVPVLPADHEARQRPLAGDQDDDHHLTGSDASPVAGPHGRCFAGVGPVDRDRAVVADLRHGAGRRDQHPGARPRVRRQHDGQRDLPRLLARPARPPST